MSIFRDAYGLRAWVIFGPAVAIMVGLTWLMIVSEIYDQKRWVAFSAAHACRKVGETDGDVGVGFAGGKTVVTSTAGKNGFLCDDGVTYWRSK